MNIEKSKYTYGRTSVYNIHYHIIWATKYRKSVIHGQVEKDLKSFIIQAGEENGFIVEHIEIGTDNHVHVMVSAPPKLSITKMVSLMKGISARKLFVKHPDLKKFYWDNANRHLWTNSYFVETIGSTSKEAVAEYIKNQKVG